VNKLIALILFFFSLSVPVNAGYFSSGAGSEQLLEEVLGAGPFVPSQAKEMVEDMVFAMGAFVPADSFISYLQSLRTTLDMKKENYALGASLPASAEEMKRLLTGPASSEEFYRKVASMSQIKATHNPSGQKISIWIGYSEAGRINVFSITPDK
jgi:hypothetical protein